MVVAAGNGVRFGGDTPKALRHIHGSPMVRHAVKSLIEGGVSYIVVMVAKGLEAAFTDALDGLPVAWRLAYGGKERQDSVRNGLSVLRSAGYGEDTVVLVHDAARPFVPGSVVATVAQAVHEGASCVIPVVPIADTIRQIGGDGSYVVDRAQLRGVQTPQGSRLGLLGRAHDDAVAANLSATDDARVCEQAGHRVSFVPGSLMGRKITDQVDYIIAEALYAARADHPL